MYINPEYEFNEEIYADDILSFIFSEFNKPPYENVFVKNYDYFISNSKQIEFNPKWNYNPYLASQDLYGNKFYYKLLLHLNPIPSLLFFNKDYLPTLNVLPISVIIDFINSRG